MVHPTRGFPPPFAFTARTGFGHPNTRVDVRLLGPCFKTGRLRPLRQRPSPKARSSVRTGRMTPPAIRRPEGRYLPGAFDRPSEPTLARPGRNAPAQVPAEPPRASLIASASLSTISRAV